MKKTGLNQDIFTIFELIMMLLAVPNILAIHRYLMKKNGIV